MLQKVEEKSLVQLGFWSGGVVFLMGILFLFLLPLEPAISNHSGLHFTMLSLELARTPEEVFGILGRPGETQSDDRVSAYLRVVDIGYIFVFFYALFGLALFETSTRMFSVPNFVRAFVYLVFILVIFANVYENLLINEILSSGLNNFQIEALERLQPITLIKWIGFFFVISVIGILVWLGSRFYFLKAGGFFLFFPFILSLFAYKRLQLIELGLMMILPGIFLFWFYYGAKIINWKRGT
jgi:hypothetical protein